MRAIILLGDLKIFRRYSDRERIVIVLLSVSPKTFSESGRRTICASGRGHSPVESELKVKIRPFFLILIAR